jgi:hypothetical protein
MCVINGQFWIIKTKDGLKLSTKDCVCDIVLCDLRHGSFTRASWGYEEAELTQPTKIKPKPKKITPTPLPAIEPDMGLPAMEIDMFFIKDLHAEEPAPQTQTLIEIPPEIGMLKQLQDLTGGNLLAAAAILLGFTWMKMQQKKKDSDEAKCGHSQEKCDKAHAELSDVFKKMELDLKDVKQVQLNLFDSLEFAEDVKNLKVDVKNLQEKIK